jgi:hypothetical protein
VLQAVIDNVAVLIPIESENKDSQQEGHAAEDAGADERLLCGDADRHGGNLNFYCHIDLLAFPRYSDESDAETAFAFGHSYAAVACDVPCRSGMHAPRQRFVRSKQAL